MTSDNPKHTAAIARIEALLLVGTPLALSWSAGKDSSVMLDITLAAAILAKQQGAIPYILVLNANTLVDNPEITAHIEQESVKLKVYAGQHDINLHFHVSVPNLNDMWSVQIISGRSLPSFPNTNSDCSVVLKINPMVQLRRKLHKNVVEKTGKEVVTLVGTRLDESTKRATNMANRNETHLAPVRNKDGDLIYTAIADFTVEDVWEWIGLVRSGLLKSYSDFNELTRIYADAGNTSCSVVSDAITEGMKAQRGGCGARTGCVVTLILLI